MPDSVRLFASPPREDQHDLFLFSYFLVSTGALYLRFPKTYISWDEPLSVVQPLGSNSLSMSASGEFARPRTASLLGSPSAASLLSSWGLANEQIVAYDLDIQEDRAPSDPAAAKSGPPVTPRQRGASGIYPPFSGSVSLSSSVSGSVSGAAAAAPVDVPPALEAAGDLTGTLS